MRIRKLSLVNAKGTEYDITSQKAFITDLSGFGFEWTTTYSNYDNFFIQQTQELKQPAPAGKLHLKGYEEFHNFALFCQYTPLTLIVTTNRTFYMDVLIKKLEKAELKNKYLESAIQFDALSPWYEKITVKNESNTAAGKVYSYAYPYTYVDSDSGVIEIDVESNQKSGIKMTVIGPVTNPSWSHTVNGEKISSGKITASVPDGHRMVVNSESAPYSLTERDGSNNFFKDLYQKSDWSTGRFVFLRPGKNIISCTHDGTEKIKMIVEAKIAYAGV